MRTSAARGRPAAALRADHALAGVARAWLRAFAALVRRADFDGARPMFHPSVVSFGTYAELVSGRAALQRRQWAHVWPAIRGFRFRLDQMRCLGGPQGVCVIVPWDSRGVRPDGTTFARPGRATLFLVPRGGRWVAAHTHFSLAPSGPKRGRR